MEDYDYSIVKSVGKVSSEALQYSRTVVKPGVKLLDAAEKIEGFIKGRGFGLAFPVNLSVNQFAAHYTPQIDDQAVFPNEGLVKVDLGARKESYLGDCAITIDLSGTRAKLVEASEDALSRAISMVRAGRKVCEIGREIEKAAKERGFVPIRNLGGHGIDKEDLHADIFIPNYDNGDETELEEGEVIAIEPFITDGAGYVKDGETIQIFQKKGETVGIRSAETRAIASFIDERYSTYPFAIRWISAEMSGQDDFRIRKALQELSYAGIMENFPVLVEKGNGMVAQAEKEMIVEKDSCSIITA